MGKNLQPGPSLNEKWYISSLFKVLLQSLYLEENRFIWANKKHMERNVLEP